MAITRAQQAKQMLREGGRIGLKPGGPPGGGATSMGSGRDFSKTQTTESSPRERGITLSQNQNKDRTRTIDDLTREEISPPERGTGLEATRQRNINIRNNIGSGITQVPKFFPGSTAINVLQNLLSNQSIKNRKFALDMSMKNRAFFKNNPLLSGGKTIYDLTEDEREDLIDQYYSARSSNQIDATGNLLSGALMLPDGTILNTDRDNDRPMQMANKTIPDPTDPTDPNQTTDVFAGIAPRFAGSIFDFDKLRREQEEEEQFAADGGRIGAMEGGIMDLESGRQMYFLGKLVKKATRAVKKIAKSPLGKAAILGGAAYFAGQGGGLGALLKKAAVGAPTNTLTGKRAFSGLFGTGGEFNLAAGLIGQNPLISGAIGLGGLSLFGNKQDEEELNMGPKLTMEQLLAIRANPYGTIMPSAAGSKFEFAADGGRIGYQEGSKEPVAKKTMPLLDMGGKEMDLRDDGGFVPIGRMEKADDVPARLSKNEFVFTADAVRNAGEGDVDKGAEVMYNMMKNLESGGQVSEESQGLEGARDMFQTSKRLEEVL